MDQDGASQSTQDCCYITFFLNPQETPLLSRMQLSLAYGVGGYLLQSPDNLIEGTLASDPFGIVFKLQQAQAEWLLKAWERKDSELLLLLEDVPLQKVVINEKRPQLVQDSATQKDKDLQESDRIWVNGISAASGDYLVPPLSRKTMAALIKKRSMPDNAHELKVLKRQKSESHLGLMPEISPHDLAECGWGVIFSADADPEVKAALAPLLDIRQAAAGQRYRCYEGQHGYQRGESKNAFLGRHGMGPGPVDPDVMPYYLLIVGSPEEIPFELQYQLDIQFAVGRVFFPTLEEYRRYAQSVVEVETQTPHLHDKRTAFFAPTHPDDPATRLSRDYLALPLVDEFSKKFKDWRFERFVDGHASRKSLAHLLGGAGTPAFLMTAGHGVGFEKDHWRQLDFQGALVCSDWQGPKRDRLMRDTYFGGADISDDARVKGMISFHMACYSAGTPDYDDFYRIAFNNPTRIAPKPFLAGLPMRMLGHPNGSALAVIGHVDKAFEHSFYWMRQRAQIQAFRSFLLCLLKGRRVGYAMETFNERFAELGADLAHEMERIDCGKQLDAEVLVHLWTAHNDARAYVVLGDPAVRLAVDFESRDSEVVQAEAGVV